MKLHTISNVVLAISTIVMATGAYANTSDVQFYTGAKAGITKFDIDNTYATQKYAKLDKATVAGVYSGIITSRNFGAEVDYSMSSNTKIPSALPESDATFKTQNFGLYGTYHLPVEDGFYLKGKLGFAHISIEDDKGENKLSNQGVAGGIGLGYNVSSRIAVETEYTRLPFIENSETEDSEVSTTTSDVMTVGAKLKF